MITNRSTPFLLLAAVFFAPVWANGPFGMGQNIKQPDFGGFQKKEKKSSHKNSLAQKPLEELKTEKSKLMAHKDYESAAKYLDAIRMVATDTEELKNCLLEMADLYYTIGDWTKAERAYQEFVMLYPGSDKYEYAYSKAANSGKKLMSEPDRDQTKTEEVLKFCQEFIEAQKSSPYLPEITQIATECRQTLFASEVNVFDFYFKSKNYKAAQKRLDSLSKEYIPALPTAEPKTLELTIQLAQAQNNTQGMLEAQFKLVTKFPEDQITKSLIASPEQVKLAWEQKFTTPITLPEQSNITVAQTPDKRIDTQTA